MKLVRSIAFWIGSVIILTMASALTGYIPAPANSLIVFGLAVGLTFLLSLGFVRWDKTTMDQIGLASDKQTILRFVFGFIIGIGLVGIQFSMVWLLGHVTISINSLSISTCLLTLVLYFLIALREEIAFRGFVLRSVSKSYGVGLGIGLTMILFAIEHRLGGMTWTQAFIGPGVGAILFAVAALRSEGLALPTGIHTAWNFIQWTMGFKDADGLFAITTEPGFESVVEAHGYWGYWLAMGVGVLLCTVLYRTSSAKHPGVPQ